MIQTPGPLIRKPTHNSESNTPQILKILGPFTSSLNNPVKRAPKNVHAIIAATHMLNVTAIIDIIPTNPPPRGSMYWLMIIITNAHSFPFTNCIAIPVFNPSLPDDFETFRDVMSNLNRATAMAKRNSIPIQCKVTNAVSFSLNESIARPTVSSITINPIAIPVIKEMLLFLPNSPL